jgi:protoheme IX farnesyltransferase
MTNPVVAALGLGNIFLYAVPYTLSKPVSEVNTWIGALVGAIPPVMGWAASSGGAIFTAEPMALASILFLWQFPHFFALSWLYREDYKKGGFMMVPCNDETGERTAKLISSYSNYLAVLPPLTSMAGLTSYMFAFEGTVLNIYLIYLARKFQNDKSNGNARRIFLYSLPYLPLLLAGYVFHSRTWNKNEIENENVIQRCI